MAAEEAAQTFAFVVPECKPGDILKVPAPDAELQVPVPETVLPGDKMYMGKDQEGRWVVLKVTRSEKVPVGQPAAAWRSQDELDKELSGPDTVRVCLTTTKGPINLVLVPQWAPLGVQRFLELVDDQFFTDVAVYRGVENFLVQFGITKNAPKTYEKMADDPLIGVPIQDGSVCFAASGANTRRNTIVFWLGDFPDFGRSPWETPIGKVTKESMAVLHSLYTGYGDLPQCGGKGPDPLKLEDLGNDYIRSEFPLADFVVSGARS